MPLEFVREKGQKAVVVRRQREREWNPDPTLFDYHSRTPSRHAPAPPKRTQYNGSNRVPQEFLYIKKVGEGGQGRCDLFKRVSDGMLFVYKLMKCRVEVDERGKPKEVKILMDILGNHRHIINMYFWSWNPSQTIYYLEYCSSGDLANLVKQYHIKHRVYVPESFIWHSYLQLSEALGFIHEGYDRNHHRSPPNFQSIVHRDIKPHNVFLRYTSPYQYPDLVLADFGLATRQIRSCEGRQDFCGTLAYQGPEIPLHSRYGDSWALGACLHDLAIGYPPISVTPRGISSSKWVERPEARRVIDVTTRGYSQDLEDAMYKVLRTDPYKRLMGKQLVEAVHRAAKRRACPREPLASWALPG